MRKTIAVAISTFLLLTAAECPARQQPAPKPSKPVVEATVVKLCIERPFNIRTDDAFCGPNRPDDCCGWDYVRDTPDWPAELPAVGEKLQTGRGFPQAPEGTTAVTVPTQGGVFPR